ncbi:MAG TPA: sigma-70 family RNA polymerase sigma factor, partial [Candidatus Kapabacteria bacterium]|nr:sigma-70 family RNA polymerase sigma factor [Candidatus Kapabacteria bacterium]
MNESDSELLRRYAEDRFEASFTELVNRKVGLVFAAALRQAGGNRTLAEEVTQSVFCDLAQKAASLWNRENLVGWLYTSTRFAAGKRVKSEQRRVIREQNLVVMQETSMKAEGGWEKLQPVIDDVMHELPERDREAVLLRYFEGRAFGEVGAKLGLSEDAARMRVDRALEKLRKLLGRKGVASTSAVLAAMLANPALTAAPAGLATSVAGAAMAGTATGAVFTTLSVMSMTKLKVAGVAVIIAGMSVPIVMQHLSNKDLQARNVLLAEKTEVLASEIEPLKRENARLTAMV